VRTKALPWLAVALLAGCDTSRVSSPDTPDVPADQPLAASGALTNDEFTGALTIRKVPYKIRQSITSATPSQPGGSTDPASSCAPFGQSYTVWYTFTPSQDRTITASTSRSTDADGPLDTVITVYTYDGTTFTEVACNDDAQVGVFGTSELSFTASAGTTYYFMVGTYANEPPGRLVFSVKRS
jgi:hypothetical protein